ncbi:tyrosine-type recombinase/integrase [Paracoccus sp. MC1854]|uniref:tyrosine-type recombinase/integrase n=1 Tax=Paracoccus sp. MC1854 TaxID=2760306 RepID=UPI0016003664|nr:tyrosine-type recombinase/integrase [Paracoccus sp. MC1854]MBB1492701.1 tyrosine-type recombinase/integrase [Paracoccus sp. MC1854]
MNHRRLPFEQWPACDQALWRELTATGSILDGSGAFAELRAATLQSRQAGYANWLGWLSRTEPDALAMAPADRVTRPRIIAWLETFSGKSPYTTLLRLDALLSVARVAAPERDWSWVRPLRQHCNYKARNHRSSRKAGRIPSSAELLQAGRDLAGTPPQDGSALQRARNLRDGTMLAFLALVPIRKRAFQALRIGQSFRVEAGTMRVVLTSELTKTGVPWDCELPETLCILMRDYLAHGRPVLQQQSEPVVDEGALWLADSGRPYSYHYIGIRISHLTKRHLGMAVPPHFFRDAAATTLARLGPEAARITPILLGHADTRTAERHYNHARMIQDNRDQIGFIQKRMAGVMDT